MKRCGRRFHTRARSTTIKDNITYGLQGLSDEDVIRALEEAKAWDFVAEKPDKLLTMIAEGGSNLSGGQKQRLAIARAMCRKPDVILLDEATSALDNENEVLVQRALDEALSGRTSVVIAHRLSTVRRADQIVVLDKGRIIEKGMHEELILQGGHYARLWETQTDLIEENAFE